MLVPHAQWVKHSLPSPLQNLRAPLPQCLQAAQHIGSALHLQFPLHQTSWQLALQLGNHSLHLSLVSSIRNGTAPPATHLKVKVARGPMLTLRKAASVSGCSTLPIQQVASHSHNQSLSSSISLPVQSRLQLIPMTGWLQRPWEHHRSW